jgi:phenylpyruvate tautomerase PptA (4-oxalocrotonate tautomerase family)
MHAPLYTQLARALAEDLATRAKGSKGEKLFQEQKKWVAYFKCLIVSQYNFYRAVHIMDSVKGSNDEEEKLELIAEIEKIAHDEIENTRITIHIIEEMDNPNFYTSFCTPLPTMRYDKGPVLGKKEVYSLKKKLDSMEAWLNEMDKGRDIPFPYAPYICEYAYPGQKVHRWGCDRLKNIDRSRYRLLGVQFLEKALILNYQPCPDCLKGISNKL